MAPTRKNLNFQYVADHLRANLGIICGQGIIPGFILEKRDEDSVAQPYSLVFTTSHTKRINQKFLVKLRVNQFKRTKRCSQSFSNGVVRPSVGKAL